MGRMQARGRGRSKMGRGKGRECTGKQPYTRTEAQEEAWHRSKRFLTKWNAYECRHCGQWHVGHARNGGSYG